MDRLIRAAAVCCLFAIWITVSAVAALWIFSGQEDPLGALVSQSSLAIRQAWQDSANGGSYSE